MKLSKSKLALILGATAYVVLYWNRLIIFGKVPFDGDILWLFYPNWMVSKQYLREGWNVLWDTYRNMGQPLLAAPHDEVLYPWRLLSIFLNYVDYQRIYIISHSLLAAGFGFALGRELLKDRRAEILMALGMGFNGFLYWRVCFITNFAAAAWLPAILYFFLKNRPIALGISLALQWLTGYPPLTILSVWCLAALCVVSCDRKERFLCLVKSGILSLGLTAVQLFPFIEMLRQSIRPLAFNPEIATVDSLHPLDLLRHLISPALLLKPIEFSNIGLSSFFLGPIFSLLFIWGLVKGGRRERIAGGLTIATLILAMGHYSGFYQRVPLFTIFRYPVNWLMLSTVGIVFVGSFGLIKLKSKVGQGIAIGLVAFDLAAYAWLPHFGWGDLKFVTESPLRIEGLQSVQPDHRIFHTNFIRQTYPQWRQDTLQDWLVTKGVLMPSYAASQGIREAASRHSLMGRRTSEYIDRMNSSLPDSPLFDYASVEKIVAVKKEAAAKITPDWEDFGVITNPNPYGRVFSLDNIPLEVLSDRPGEMKIKATGPGRVVVSEAFYPGWKVKVDGYPYTLETFEEIFLSANLPEGTHELRFYYRPASFIAGFVITLITLFGLAGLVFYRRSLL